MSTRDSLTLLRGVHTHAHMYTQSCDDISIVAQRAHHIKLPFQ